MAVALNRTPFPVTYRELWLPQHVRGTQLPPFRGNANLLTLTGAQKGTTCDGVHFTGAVTSNINQGALHNAQAKFARSLRFKLDTNHTAGAGTKQIWGKYIDDDNLLRVTLSNADGLIHFVHRQAAVTLFDISVGTGTLTGGVWHHVYAATGQSAVGGAASDGARLRLDNGVAATNANVTALPNGGDLIIGDLDDPGLGLGFIGIISDVFDMTDDVTETEEENLYNGKPPDDAVHVYLLDEGQGVTATDRGSGANNGTLDTACTWAFGQVKQNVLSLEGINDYALSGAGLSIAPDWTFIVVVKCKNNQDATIPTSGTVANCSVDGDNYFIIFHDAGTDGLLGTLSGSGTSQQLSYTTKPAIDDYRVYILLYRRSGAWYLYLNGSAILTGSGVGVITGGAATINFGARTTLDYFGNDKLLAAALVDGTFTAKQARNYSRYLKDMFNLPISI